MAHKRVEKDGVEYVAQEIMRVGSGVRVKVFPVGTTPTEGVDSFDWIDARVFDASPDYVGEGTGLVVPPGIRRVTISVPEPPAPEPPKTIDFEQIKHSIEETGFRITQPLIVPVAETETDDTATD